MYCKCRKIKGINYPGESNNPERVLKSVLYVSVAVFIAYDIASSPKLDLFRTKPRQGRRGVSSQSWIGVTSAETNPFCDGSSHWRPCCRAEEQYFKSIRNTVTCSKHSTPYRATGLNQDHREETTTLFTSEIASSVV